MPLSSMVVIIVVVVVVIFVVVVLVVVLVVVVVDVVVDVVVVSFSVRVESVKIPSHIGLRIMERSLPPPSQE